MSWDSSVHNQVGGGGAFCGNGNQRPCPPLGYLRHAGKRFSNAVGLKAGMAVTARGEVVGPVGGYAWILELDGGAPRNLRLDDVEVLPETPMIISIAYPVGTTVNITVHAPTWCWKGSAQFSCAQSFTEAASLPQVRSGPGNQYFMDSNGVLTFRVAQLPQGYIGRPNWFIPSRTDLDTSGKAFATARFERSGVYLPKASYASYHIDAICPGSGPYCSGTPVVFDPDVCPSGFEQKAYDYCCSKTNPSNCVYAGGSV
jgi:hypothetical protein